MLEWRSAHRVSATIYMAFQSAFGASGEFKLKVMPVVLLLSVAVALGLFLGMQYLRGVRASKVLIGVHLLLGAAGLEALARLLWGTTPDGTLLPAGTVGTVAAVLLAVAMFCGLTAPVLARRLPRTIHFAVATHVGIGAAGFVLFLLWATRIQQG